MREEHETCVTSVSIAGMGTADGTDPVPVTEEAIFITGAVT